MSNKSGGSIDSTANNEITAHLHLTALLEAAVTGVSAAEEVDTVVEEVDMVAPHEVVVPSTGMATATLTLLVPARVLAQVLS